MAPATSFETQTTPHVVIAGSGVIGLSTAFYLAENYGISSTIVDPSGNIAPAASGKAGGFLALDWNDFSPVGSLARRSFALHQDLADKLGADRLQYRRLTCASIAAHPADSRKPKGKKLRGVEWAEDAAAYRSLGDESTIAQVHPKRLCESLWNYTVAKVGATLVKGRVVGPVHQDALVGAKLHDGRIISCDSLLFACGPWTANIMTGVKYHSAVIPTERVLNQCVFFSGAGDPEVYVRPDGSAYCTGFPDPAIQVYEEAGEEEVRPDAIDRIVRAVREASGGTETALSADPILRQACYLPSTPDGLPLMGRLQEEVVGGEGCFVAAGHSCWGILLGPASGEAMATLIATGRESQVVDMRYYKPERFRGLEVVPSSLSKRV